MNNIMEYKGYKGTVEYSDKNKVLFGRILGINDLKEYHGKSVDTLKQEFELVVDAYLAACKENQIEPDKTYKGKFNVRIDPKLHKEVSIIAQAQHISLNQFVENSLRDKAAALKNKD